MYGGGGAEANVSGSACAEESGSRVGALAVPGLNVEVVGFWLSAGCVAADAVGSCAADVSAAGAVESLTEVAVVLSKLCCSGPE